MQVLVLRCGTFSKLMLPLSSKDCDCLESFKIERFWSYYRETFSKRLLYFQSTFIALSNFDEFWIVWPGLVNWSVGQLQYSSTLGILDIKLYPIVSTTSITWSPTYFRINYVTSVKSEGRSLLRMFVILPSSKAKSHFKT